MKFQVHFKTPGALSHGIKQAMADEGCFDEIEGDDGWAAKEGNELLGDEMNDVARKFMKYGECITVEFDTETGTAVVLPASK